MNTVGYIGIASLVVLLIPVLIVNKLLSIKMNKRILIAVVRMIIQLSLVGLYLQYIFELNNWLLNVGYLALMMFVATLSISKASNLNGRMVYLPIYISLLIPDFLMVLFFNFFVIGLTNVFDARYLITIGGMLLGNGLNGDIIGLNTYYKGIAANRSSVNYDLALGATRFQATKGYFKDAIVASIRPTVASMATIGLVSLPGMMTGQILGGSVPRQAIMYQIAIMLAIFTTSYVNIFMSIVLSQNLMFTPNDQLKIRNM